jgi:hypothetical protein
VFGVVRPGDPVRPAEADSETIPVAAVVDSQAFGRLYASPVSPVRFEENGGKTNTSLVRLVGHAVGGAGAPDRRASDRRLLQGLATRGFHAKSAESAACVASFPVTVSRHAVMAPAPDSSPTIRERASTSSASREPVRGKASSSTASALSRAKRSPSTTALVSVPRLAGGQTAEIRCTPMGQGGGPYAG